MRTPEQMHQLYLDRQKARGPVLTRMEQVRDQYNGDVVTPLPELDRDGGMYVANLLQQGLDHYGRRIASVMPQLDVAPIDPRSETSRKRADVKRRAVASWWEADKLDLMLFRRARWLVGYASSPVVIRPNFELGIPRREPRNPLSCYPGPTVDPDELRPPDCIFAVRKPLGWLRRVYPQAAVALFPEQKRECGDDKLVTILEYEDDEQTAMLACGDQLYYGDRTGRYAKEILLAWTGNETGLCNAIVPGRITLDRPTGQFDGILGMLQMQAKLMALEVMAVQKGVFPDTYMISRPNETARFISGPHPGWTGKINEIEGGEITSISPQPGFQTNPTIDRIERAARLEGGISPEFGGESGTNIRTGRRGDAILSAMVDFPVQEAQQVLARSLEEENRSGIAVAKAFFGDRRVSVYVRWKSAKGPLDYKASDFENEYTQVTYPMAGADVQNLTIGVGQLVGTEMMSKQTGRRLHPWIDDPDLEGDLVMAEGLQAAVLASLQTKANSGEIPVDDAARITELVVEENMPLYKAIRQAQQEAQRRQAQVTAEGQPDGVLPGSPAAQPGLALPGAGAEAAVAPIIPEPGPNIQNLSDMMHTLRSAGPRPLPMGG